MDSHGPARPGGFCRQIISPLSDCVGRTFQVRRAFEVGRDVP